MRAAFTPARRRAAALGLVALLGALVYAALVRPAVEAHRRYDGQIADMTDRLAQYRRAARDGEATQRLLAERRRADRARQRYLSESNPALASAELQDMVKRAVELGRGELISTQVLSAQRVDASPEITVRVRVRGGVRTLHRMLHALEGDSPMLFVNNLSIDSASGDLVMGFDVTGHTRERRGVALGGAGARLVPISLVGPEYEEIVTRSLFVPSRRTVPERAGETRAAAPARELTLAGVLITRKRKLALLRESGSSRDIRLEPGEAVGDWTLAEVKTDSVMLRNGAQTRELVIHRPHPMQ